MTSSSLRKTSVKSNGMWASIAASQQNSSDGARGPHVLAGADRPPELLALRDSLADAAGRRSQLASTMRSRYASRFTPWKGSIGVRSRLSRGQRRLGIETLIGRPRNVAAFDPALAQRPARAVEQHELGVGAPDVEDQRAARHLHDDPSLGHQAPGEGIASSWRDDSDQFFRRSTQWARRMRAASA